jgi:hypothetical protein
MKAKFGAWMEKVQITPVSTQIDRGTVSMIS